MNRVDTTAALAALIAAPTLILPFLMIWNKKPQQTNEPSEEAADFTDKLQGQLLGLSIQSYEQLIAQVLRAVGYESVRVLRDPRPSRHSHKGRNRHGGYDITAIVSTEFSTHPVLVQVKQYARPISRRFVDELRGALLRTQARQGLLITTSTFAPRAREAAQEDYIGPIYLIDGAELHELLVRYRLGVGENKRGKLYLKKRFFHRLERFVSQEPKITWEQV